MDSANVAAPFLTRLYAPETIPLKVSVFAFTVMPLFPGRATAPLKVIELVPVKMRSDVKVSTLDALNNVVEASSEPPLTVKAPVPAAVALPKLNVPLDTVSPPPKVFAPERVNVPVLLTEPAPEMIPEELPPAMVAVFVVAIATAPPFKLVIEVFALTLTLPEPAAVKVVIVDVPPSVKVLVPEELTMSMVLFAPFKVSVEAAPDSVVTLAVPVTVVEPADTVEAVVAPRVPAVIVPPEIALFNAPVTVTVPAEIPLVIVASLENAVVPAPERVVTVVAADVPVKFTLPALLTEATVRPVPETLAVALAATVSAAEELKSAAFKVPPLTVMPEVLAMDPAEVVRIPAVTVVAPE